MSCAEASCSLSAGEKESKHLNLAGVRGASCISESAYRVRKLAKVGSKRLGEISIRG